MIRALIPPLAGTVAPTVLIVAVAYVLRPQGGRHGAAPLTTHPVPAAAVLARLSDEIDSGEIPWDLYGGVGRPSGWTVPGDLELSR